MRSTMTVGMFERFKVLHNIIIFTALFQNVLSRFMFVLGVLITLTAVR